MDTLIFPDTDIFKARIYPLLLFSSPLHFLQIVEAGSGTKKHEEPSLFLERGLCCPHSPTPLKDKRKEFLKLIETVKERLGQLPDVLKSNTDKEATSEFLSLLLQENTAAQGMDKTEFELWQARLILAIAEILDNEREDLHEQLLAFSEDEAAALHDLQGENGSKVDNLLGSVKKVKNQLENHQAKDSTLRFDAWFRLLRNQATPPAKLWVASSRAGAEHIFERYKTTGKGNVVPILQLALPGYFLESAKYIVEQIEAFQKATRTIHQGLNADFDRITMNPQYDQDSISSLLPYKTDWAAHWEALLYEFFPTSSYGRNTLTFYLLPHQSITSLLSLPEPDRSATEPMHHGLLGILGNS